MSIVLAFLGFSLGLVVLVNNLRVFSSQSRSPVMESWLVLVGTLAWSLIFFTEIWQDALVSIEVVFARFLFFVFWCGQLLRVKRYCLILKKRRMLKVGKLHD